MAELPIDVLKAVQLAEQRNFALQMFAQTLPDEQAMEIATVYPEWATDVAYSIGTFVTHRKDSIKNNFK